MDSIPKKMPDETTLTKKTGEAIFIKPCEMMASNKPTETMLLKPCETISTEKTAGTIPIKPCETISERSMKKRRVMPREVEEEEKKEEHLDDDEGDDDEEDEVPAVEIEVGKHVDVKALLSSKSRNFLVTTKGGEVVPIADLDGKFVLVCCFLVPFNTSQPEASTFRSIEALYSELSLQGNADEVKLVIVGKIDPGFTMSNFDSFFSMLSVDCLAIPFSDTESRDKVCESLYFCTKGISRYVPCLAVHPSGEVLMLDSCFLNTYGGQSFPFSRQHFSNIDSQDKIIGDRLCSTNSTICLRELLQCNYVSRIANENNLIPTSDFRDIPVALYLCYDGKFMVKLQDILQKCLDEGHKLEIVLVPLPFDRRYDPASFNNLMKQSALKNQRSSSWLAFPFNDKICRTLWRLFYCYEEDQLIILPHGNRPGDLWGKQIATLYGVEAYPFTRDIIIQRKVSEIRSITLEQFLGGTHMSDLHNKNVLLYLDYPTLDYDDECRYKILNQDYCEFKVKYPGSEVFFVPLGPMFHSISGQKFRKCVSKWPILPSKMWASVEKHIYGNGSVYPTLVTIGKDGKILSRCAQYNQPQSDSSVSLFDDTLASEILKGLDGEITRL
ncbi:hypothetical protein vseg_012648 [Gypsophila vaccaria]